MSKEKLLKLVTYQAKIKDKLSEKEIPEKHKNRVQQYKEFLTSELKKVTKTIETITISGDSKK